MKYVGGLLFVNRLGYHQMLQRLVGSCDDYNEDQETVDLQQLRQLRQIVLFKKENILDHTAI